MSKRDWYWCSREDYTAWHGFFDMYDGRSMGFARIMDCFKIHLLCLHMAVCECFAWGVREKGGMYAATI